MAAKRRERQQPEAGVMEMRLAEVLRSQISPSEEYEPITLRTSRGDIEGRYYAVPGATCGAILVGGAGGGFDTPVRGWLYPRLCQQLQQDGLAALRIRYRHPNDLEECTLDVLAGVHFLESEGVKAVALVGHSFGGAVVIQAAAHAPTVRTCVPLSTQTYGVEPARTLGPHCSLLLGHGRSDEVLPPSCSEYAFSIAREPKRLLIKDGARHGLDEWADELPDLLRNWINSRLPHGGA